MAQINRPAPIPEFSVGAGLGNVQRIRDLAKLKGIDVARATERFTLEASLRRIFSSKHADKFGFMTLKGGSLMYFSEGVDPLDGRSTRDIDIELSGFKGTLDELKAILQDVLSQIPDVDDGVRFHVQAMETNPVAEDRAVPGGSISCPVQIGQSMYEFKVDAGFHPEDHKDDVIVRDYDTLIPKKLSTFPVPCRPIEYAFADKLQACVRHGIFNTRLRDFYDMLVFFDRVSIDMDLAAKAIEKVFVLYKEEGIPTSVADIPALSPEYAEKNAARWESMRASKDWAVPMPTLHEATARLRELIQPVLDHVHARTPRP